MAAEWNRKSGVVRCDICNGHGVVYADRWPDVDDPYPTDPCPEGCEPHEAECGVCGYRLEVTGYDCIVCETVASLDEKALFNIDAQDFANAMSAAIDAARREREVQS